MNREQKRNIERWKQAIRVLKALSPHERKKHWDMGTWGEKTDCGTIACAAGHCAMDPWFQRRGFRLVFDGLSNEEKADGAVDMGNLSMEADEFFDEDGVRNIFHNTTKRSVNDVIKEIQAHVKKLETVPKLEAEMEKIKDAIEKLEARRDEIGYELN